MPLDIYQVGEYKKTNKGVQSKGNDRRNSPTIHLGLMKSYMPIPKAKGDEKLYENKIVEVENDTSNKKRALYQRLKSSDKSTLKVGSLWAEIISNTYVHPYSNSISGTTLCQIRMLCHLAKNHHKLPINENEISLNISTHEYKQ